MKRTQIRDIQTISSQSQLSAYHSILTEDESSDDDLCSCCISGKPGESYPCLPKKDGCFMEFLRDSSLHGLKYIGQIGRRPSERMFWFVAVCVGLGLSIFLIKGVIDQLLANPVIIAFQASDTTIDQIPFPAFTICNVNKVKLSGVKVADKYVKEYLYAIDNNLTSPPVPHGQYMALQYFHHYCEVCKSFSSKFGYHLDDENVPQIQENSDIKLIENGTVNSTTRYYLAMGLYSSCNDMILHCIWKHQQFSCETIFQTVFTEFGLCCVFNSIPRFIMLRQNASRSSVFERQLSPDVVKQWSEWQLDKKLVTDDNPDSNSKTKETYPRHQMNPGLNGGLSILINPQLEEYYCPIYDGKGLQGEVHSPADFPHVLSFGKSLKPNTETFVSVRAELTITDGDVETLPLDQRKCYFSHEYSLRFSKLYTQRNCVDECIANSTVQYCLCVRFHMPRGEGIPLCNEEQTLCAEQVKEYFTDFGFEKLCPECLPSCTQIEYISDTSSLPMRKDVNLWRNGSGFDEKWANANVSIVHVFLAGNVNLKARKKLYQWDDLLAQVGGLLGFTLGLSVMSVVEPIYFFTLRQWCKPKEERYNKLEKAIQIRRKRSEIRRPTPTFGHFSPRGPPRQILDKVTVGAPTKRILVNPADFIKWSDTYSKDPKMRPRLVKYPLDFIRPHHSVWNGENN